MKSRAVVLLFFFVSCCIIFNRQEWKKNIYYNDSFGYYLYLPATFIYHDLGKLAFLPSVHEKYNGTFGEGLFTIYDGTNGRKNDKYAVGCSLFELPLFCVAHLYCKISGRYDADGFSVPYQLAGICSCLLWVVAGLFVLRKFLLAYFSDPVVAITLLCIAFGTNLYYYTAFAQGASHPFSFFLFSSILYCTQLWYRRPQVKYLYCTALLLGLIVIMRPVNIIIALIPLLWQVYDLPSLKARLRLFKGHYKEIAVCSLLFLPVLFLQLAYWKYTSGHWIYFSYRDDGFDFLHPNIMRGLFSYRKGWFVYTPIAFIGMIGFFALWKKNKKLLPAIVAFFVLLIYIVFSWKNWWYGGGFGCRPLIESLAVLAVPLAALIERVQIVRSSLLSFSCCIVLACCIVLNIFQAWQFSHAIIHHDRMSKEYYWRVFGKTQINNADYEKYLMDEKEYWKELNGASK